LFCHLQAWSAYGEERYIPLYKDSRSTGVYLREVMTLFKEKVNAAYLICWPEKKKNKNTILVSIAQNFEIRWWNIFEIGLCCHIRI